MTRKRFARSSGMLTYQETALSWGDEPAWIGLLQDSVGQVGDARGVDDPDQADDKLIEQTGLEALAHDRHPHEGHG